MKKKIAILLALLAALALIFVAGCSDDSDSSGSSALAGTTWEYSDTYDSLTSERGNVVTVLQTTTDTYSVYFASGGTFTVRYTETVTNETTGKEETTDYGVIQSGTWSLSGTALTLTMIGDDGVSVSYTIIYNGGDTVTFFGDVYTRVS